MAFGVGIQFDLSGLKQAFSVKQKDVAKAARKALREGAKPIIKEVKAELKELSAKAGWKHTGLTAQSIGVLWLKKRRGSAGVLALKIGARQGIKVKRQAGGGISKVATRYRRLVKQGRKLTIFAPDKVLHLLELGTKPHQVGSRRHPGAKAYPSLRPATQKLTAEAQAIVAAVLRQAIES